MPNKICFLYQKSRTKGIFDFTSCFRKESVCIKFTNASRYANLSHVVNRFFIRFYWIYLSQLQHMSLTMNRKHELIWAVNMWRDFIGWVIELLTVLHAYLFSANWWCKIFFLNSYSLCIKTVFLWQYVLMINIFLLLLV